MLGVVEVGEDEGGERKRERRKKLVFIIFLQLLEHHCLGIADVKVQTGPITAHYKKNQSFGHSNSFQNKGNILIRWENKYYSLWENKT